MHTNTEVDNNFAYFKTKLAGLKQTHFKEFVLPHKKQVIGFFESENDAISNDAISIGTKDYGKGCFSVQQVIDAKIDLGYQSCVII